MTIDLYLDDDTGMPELSAQASRSGCRVVRSDDVGMRGRPDIDHLRFASANGLVLVTCNRRDFLDLHWRFLERPEPHAGIVIVSQTLPKGERIRLLLSFARLAVPRDMANNLELLKDWA